MPDLCRICHSRRPKRHCPGVDGDICSLCCGDQREVNISCPLDCEFLQAARAHEKPIELEKSAIPNRDIRLNEAFLSEHDGLILFSMFTIVNAALRTPGAVDSDVLKALEALIRTYRTTEAGLVYETKAVDRIAAELQDQFERSLADFQKEQGKSEATTSFRPAEILGALVFVERSALTRQNGRPRGRAFIDYARQRLNVPLPEKSVNLLIQ